MACLQSCCSLLGREAPASFSLASASSPAFSSPLPSYPSLSCSRAPAVKLTTCALSDNDKQESSGAASSIRRNILVGVVATGAALAVFSNSSMAAIGPGGDGNRRTAEKADELLKAADKLNIEDAPKRFGPGRPGPVQDPTKISQIAGSGSGAVAKEGAAAAEEGEKLGDAARSAIGQAQSKPSQLGAAARDAVGQADTKKFSDDLGNAEGGVFKPFQQGFKNLRDTAERTGSEARSTVADVVSKNKP